MLRYSIRKNTNGSLRAVASVENEPVNVTGVTSDVTGHFLMVVTALGKVVTRSKGYGWLHAPKDEVSQHGLHKEKTIAK
jgi:hypothetical protein